MPKNINFITIIITLEGTEKIKTEKMRTTTFKLNGFYFPSMKIHHRAKLTRNYKIWPFEFSKIVTDMKGKFSSFKAYLYDCLILTFHWLISLD